MDFLKPELFPPIERIELDVFGPTIRCVMWADGDRHFQETFRAADPPRMQHLLAAIELMLAPQLGYDTDAILNRHRQAGVYQDGTGAQPEEPEDRRDHLPGAGRRSGDLHAEARDPERGRRRPEGTGGDGGPA